MRGFEFRFEFVDAVFLESQLALEQFTVRIILPTTRAEREREETERGRTPEVHFGLRSASYCDRESVRGL